MWWFLLDFAIGAWVYFDAKSRKIDQPILWAIGSVFLWIIVVPFYFAKRPLKSGEVREGGTAWNVIKSFAIFWTLLMFIIGVSGMMFVGDRGKILAGFRGENPRLIPESRMAGISDKEPESSEPDTNEAWIQAFRSNSEARGSFLLAGPVSETILLGTVSLRAGKRVEYDSESMTITNAPEANQFLTREYRPGWEI